MVVTQEQARELFANGLRTRTTTALRRRTPGLTDRAATPWSSPQPALPGTGRAIVDAIEATAKRDVEHRFDFKS